MSQHKKVLVTGAAGFIGSHLVELLVREGYTVHAMTRYTSAADKRGNLGDLSAEILREVELYPADLRDSEAVLKATAGMEAIFHLGAIISIPYSYQHPEETVAVNINGTLNILQAMRQHNTPRGVIVSTSEVYGTAQYVPIDEKHPLQAQSPYAASKIAAEALALSFHKSYNLPIVVVRPFNTYGERQSARAVIPTIISQTLTRDVVQLGAIHTFRDYTHAQDTARGLMLAAFGKADAIGKTLNLGTGESHTIGEIAEMIISLIGREVTLQANQDERLRPEKSEVLRLQSNNSMARNIINWTPQISLEAGLQRTIDWISAHLDKFAPESYQI